MPILQVKYMLDQEKTTDAEVTTQTAEAADKAEETKEAVKEKTAPEPSKPAEPEPDYDDEDDYIDVDTDDEDGEDDFIEIDDDFIDGIEVDDEDDFIEADPGNEDDFIEADPGNEDDFVEDDLGDEDEFEEVIVRPAAPVRPARPAGSGQSVRRPSNSFYMENEDLEDDGVKKKKHTAGKVIGKIILGLIIFAAVAYFGIAAFFVKHFYYATKINGVDFSLRSVEDVEKYMSKQVDHYKLTLQEVKGKEEVINGADIGISYRKGTQIGRELKKQNPLTWIKALWEPDDLTVDVGVEYDEDKLAAQLKKLNCTDKSKWTKPKNARPEYNGRRFAVKDEVYGSALIRKTFNKEVRNCIVGSIPTLNLQEAGCYRKPRYVSTSKAVIRACRKMNKYSKASITYTFGDAEEVVDRDIIKDWLTVNTRNMKVTYNEGKVDAYVARMAEKYDTLDKVRTFKGHDGKIYKVDPGTYGWSIDQETEVAALKESIRKGETVTKEPAYLTTARSHSARDWGRTYAEVSISQQHMWYYRKGKVIFDTDVVTGLPTPKKATPTGMHQCLEKAQNKVLRGERMSNGQPEYETPVAYWMRVTWSGVGFHTATWQPFFGGNRYTYAGSHGCINMSYSDSQTLYGLIEVGDAVIIHE